MLLDANLAAGDVIGFTFFIGYMAMFAATVFFFFERQNVTGKWKTSQHRQNFICLQRKTSQFVLIQIAMIFLLQNGKHEKSKIRKVSIDRGL